MSSPQSNTSICKVRQYHYSSVKSTGSQSLSVQLTWSRVQFRRTCLWSRVKGMRIPSLLDRRPLRWRLLWTFCVEMLTPTAFLNSFRRVVAFTKGWRLACPTRNRSCIGVVGRCRPPAWHWVADPDVWRRFHALGVTLWLTPKMMATLAVKTHIFQHTHDPGQFFSGQPTTLMLRRHSGPQIR